jgi:hypothetical protein
MAQWPGADRRCHIAFSLGITGDETGLACQAVTGMMRRRQPISVT